MKSLVFTLVLALTLVAVRPVYAQEVQVCTTYYGGGVVCGAKHEAIDTDLGDINTFVLGAGLLLASFGLYRLSKKLKRTYSDHQNLLW